MQILIIVMSLLSPWLAEGSTLPCYSKHSLHFEARTSDTASGWPAAAGLEGAGGPLQPSTDAIAAKSVSMFWRGVSSGSLGLHRAFRLAGWSMAYSIITQGIDRLKNFKID